MAPLQSSWGLGEGRGRQWSVDLPFGKVQSWWLSHSVQVIVFNAKSSCSLLEWKRRRDNQTILKTFSSWEKTILTFISRVMLCCQSHTLFILPLQKKKWVSYGSVVMLGIQIIYIRREVNLNKGRKEKKKKVEKKNCSLKKFKDWTLNSLWYN